MSDPVFVDLSGTPIASKQRMAELKEQQAQFNNKLQNTVKMLRDWYVMCELGVISPEMFVDPEFSNLIVRAHADTKQILLNWGIDLTMRAKKRHPAITTAKLQTVPSLKIVPREPEDENDTRPS